VHTRNECLARDCVGAAVRVYLSFCAWLRARPSARVLHIDAHMCRVAWLRARPSARVLHIDAHMCRVDVLPKEHGIQLLHFHPAFIAGTLARQGG
jgi:hypothetical protein